MAAFSLSLPKRWQPASIWALYAVGLIPAIWQFYLGATGNLGADPVKTFELFLGLWTLRFLILTLAVTPARDLFGWNFLRYRRALGLLTFYYALMHFSVYMILDQALYLQAVVQDVLRRPFIMFGMAGLTMLLPLALTSNSFSIRRMGKNWIWLHRLIYIIAACGVLHYALSTKVLSGEQYFYIGLLLAALLYRSYRPILMQRRKAARRPTEMERSRAA
ncbi:MULTISPECIES: protein-methionine-sulfoxide reductase heme-binding subunit MsrQ [unclassified Sinorhizobium]|uniref:protein-methionine-sulfoxide reductase heme-binding subunit MsrQ n=1 Tax=unclassified Sinorhizobium TaxID=2613772 RepID=UPI0035237F4A